MFTQLPQWLEVRVFLSSSVAMGEAAAQPDLAGFATNLSQFTEALTALTKQVASGAVSAGGDNAPKTKSKPKVDAKRRTALEQKWEADYPCVPFGSARTAPGNACLSLFLEMAEDKAAAEPVPWCRYTSVEDEEAQPYLSPAMFPSS